MKENVGSLEIAANSRNPSQHQPCGKSDLEEPRGLPARKESVRIVADLLLGIALAAAHLLGLEVLVQQVESSLVGLGASHNGEHALTSIVMGCLGDADTGSRSLADLADLAASSSNDASNHVGRNADVLGLELLSILVMGGWSTLSSIRVGSAVVVRTRSSCLAEVVSVAGSHDAGVVVATTLVAAGLATNTGSSARLSTNNRIVQNGTSSSLPIIDQALANLPGSLLDAFRVALNLNNALGRLGKHLLLRNHADTRDVLNVLNLKALSTDDRTHLVVGNQQLDC